MIELTKDNFDHEVTEAAGRVLVDFWSPGCGPCRAMEPVLASAASRHPDVKFAKMNAAENPDVAWAFNVVAIPTLVLFEDGRPIADLTGAVPAQRIDELLSAVAEDDAETEVREVTLFIAMSLDGYIADSDGGVDWLAGHDPAGPEPDSYDRFIAGIDTVLMGWNTYRQVTEELSPEAWPYEGLDTWVVTHRSPFPVEGVRFTSEDPAQLVRRLQQEEGRGIWVCGGASLAQQLMREGLIDRLHLSVIPTILGSGIPLFEHDGPQLNLRLVRTETCNGIVDLVYEKRDEIDRIAVI